MGEPMPRSVKLARCALLALAGGLLAELVAGVALKSLAALAGA